MPLRHAWPTRKESLACHAQRRMMRAPLGTRQVTSIQGTSMATKKAKVANPDKVRNRYATHPLLKKGGVHAKTRKAERKADKQVLGREWPGQNACG